MFYYIKEIMEREYGNDLQDKLSELLSINGFRWVSRSGNSGWSKEFHTGYKEELDRLHLEIVKTKKFTEY